MAMGMGRLAAGIAAVVAFGLGTAAAQTTVTFRFNDPEAPVMRQALDAFEKQHPDIKVTMQRVTWADAQQQFLREAAVGTAPDVAQLAQVWPRSFGKAGALRPLDDLIQKTNIGVAGWDQFIAREMQAGPDGKIYGIPFTIDTFAMVYNKDLLKAAGYDAFPKDWKTLREASQAVFRKTGKTGFGFPAGSCGTPGIWFYLNFYWWSHGWALIDDAPGGKFKVGITPDQIAEGFDYYNQFLKDGDNPRAHLSICLWSAPEIVEGMASGNIAMASVPDAVGVQIVNTYKQRNPDKPIPLAAAIHPADVNGSKTFFGGRSLGISANSKNVEQSWKLIRYLSTPEPTFTKYYTNYVQPQKALMNYDRLPAEIAPGFTDQLQRARTWGPYGLGPVAIPFMWNAVGRAAGAVFIGEKTAKVAGTELH
ncbi:MAG: sugar ABC transporter substrate-binding protein [Proteobacteria bacterium]|nr:sugar ABC transporter substrate-binding protein [Pseudomonadota bacterium]